MIKEKKLTDSPVALYLNTLANIEDCERMIQEYFSNTDSIEEDLKELQEKYRLDKKQLTEIKENLLSEKDTKVKLFGRVHMLQFELIFLRNKIKFDKEVLDTEKMILDPFKAKELLETKLKTAKREMRKYVIKSLIQVLEKKEEEVTPEKIEELFKDYYVNFIPTNFDIFKESIKAEDVEKYLKKIEITKLAREKNPKVN